MGGCLTVTLDVCVLLLMDIHVNVNGAAIMK